MCLDEGLIVGFNLDRNRPRSLRPCDRPQRTQAGLTAARARGPQRRAQTQTQWQEAHARSRGPAATCPRVVGRSVRRPAAVPVSFRSLPHLRSTRSCWRIATSPSVKSRQHWSIAQPRHGQLGREFPGRWFTTKLNKHSARGPHHLVVRLDHVWRDGRHVFYLLKQVDESYRGLYELGSLDTAQTPLPRTESA